MRTKRELLGTAANKLIGVCACRHWVRYARWSACHACRVCACRGGFWDTGGFLAASDFLAAWRARRFSRQTSSDLPCGGWSSHDTYRKHSGVTSDDDGGAGGAMAGVGSSLLNRYGVGDGD